MKHGLGILNCAVINPVLINDTRNRNLSRNGMFPTIVLASQVWIVHPCVLPVWRGTQDLRPRTWRVDAPRMERKGTDRCKGWESAGRPREKDIRNSCASSMETSLSIPTHTDTLSNTVLELCTLPEQGRSSHYEFEWAVTGLSHYLHRKIILFYSAINLWKLLLNKFEYIFLDETILDENFFI